MMDMDEAPRYADTIGERLRRARERRGLSLDDVATQTRIPIRHLRNIESENWGELPSVTYTVGFTRSYANAIGLDGAGIGRELREQLGGETRPSRVSPEIYAPPDPARVPSRSLAWIAGIALIVLIAGWLLVVRPYLTRADEDVAEAPPPAEQSAQPVTQPQQAPQQQVPQNLTGQQVTLVAVQPVWLRITDRTGNRRLVERTLQPGEQLPVPTDAQQPVIRTSEPQNLRVQIAGRDLGLMSAQRRSLRDFSLLPTDLSQAVAGQGQAPVPGQAPGTAPPVATPQ